MEKWNGKVAVVTGASSGIGEETCRQLVERGMIVVGFARREDKLQELEKDLKGKLGKFYYVKVDLCSEENIMEAFNWVKSTLKSVDVLVNNAGVLKKSDLLGNTNDWKQMFDTNVMGLNICSREAIKIMEEIQIKEGHIININSVGGHYQFQFVKDFSVYCATKHTVTIITESLRELMGMKNLPVRVTSISPGAVDTEMTLEFSKMEGFKMLKSIDIAEAILYALSAPQRVNVAEIIIRPTGENTAGLIKNFV
ncbi:short-chain dehydrogenase/reductase-like [Acyrthosiphon pisum]|uniref:ACYPI009545 protein n=1 Tax=Acyrthosiphon pisum TaxID=7029 RepID=C4WWZ9_ACYPI|nr:short-chain dehydrogenase/reductase-like [Acyrthosiphon pisum]BAH72419.1 ACYPI009545 [Acyrthosiphon pisum]|eukprot:NP_001153866.1 short-chain dehydrogenase/reductase-like [Acyrthosiphon pisum]